MIKICASIYNQLMTSKYFRNLFTLTTGVGLSQLVPLFLLPILTRFFSPEDFGLFALFLAIIQLLAICSTFRLEMAVVLPKKDTDAALLCFISIIIMIIFLLLTFLLLYFYGSSIIQFPAIIHFHWFMYLIPVGAFFLAFYNILYSWNNRLELYKKMSYSHVTHSLFSTPSSILLYFLNLKPIGLVLGQIIGRAIACFVLFTNLLKTLKLIHRHQLFQNISLLLKQYQKFIFFETPHAVLNFFSQKYIILFFTYFFTFSTVGVFDLADKIIGKPLGIISNSFKTVFYKRLTTAKDKLTLFKRSIALTACISFCLITPLYIIPDSWFIVLLGSEWIDVGKYIKLICPLFFSKFVFNVVTPSVSYTLKNHYLLIWQIIYVVLLVLLFSRINSVDVEYILLTYSLFGAFMYICLGGISFVVLKNHIES